MGSQVGRSIDYIDDVARSPCAELCAAPRIAHRLPSLLAAATTTTPTTNRQIRCFNLKWNINVRISLLQNCERDRESGQREMCVYECDFFGRQTEAGIVPLAGLGRTEVSTNLNLYGRIPAAVAVAAVVRAARPSCEHNASAMQSETEDQTRRVIALR